MKTAGLRAIMRNYGPPGVLAVGLYLVAHHGWTKRRPALLASLLALTIGVFLIWPHPRPKRLRAALAPPLPAPIVAPSSAPPEESLVLSDYQPRVSLLAHAQRITTLDTHYRTHCWLSSHRLLLVYGKEDNSHEDDSPDALTHWQGYAEYLDTYTGQYHPLRGLTRLLNRIQGTPGCFLPSPHGKWLQWSNFQTDDVWPCPVFARLDGSHFQEASQDKFSNTYWIDDHRWAEQKVRPEDNPHLIVHDMNHPNKEQRFSLESDQALRRMRLHEEDYMDADPIHASPVHLPKELENLEFYASCQHDRIVYRFQCYAILSSSGTSRTAKPIRVSALWVSRLDGSQLHELGYVPIDPDSGYFDCPIGAKMRLLQQLEWLPNSRRVAFLYHNAIYTVAVD